MVFFAKKKEKVINGLLNIRDNEEMKNALIYLQNEIGVSFSTKVIAISSISCDDLAAAYAKAFAEVYGYNNEKTLIIDANMYNPCLAKMLEDLKVEKGDKVDIVSLDKEIYPAEAYKSGAVKKVLEEHKDKYTHYLILVPSIDEHKEISLIADSLDSIILVTRRNFTRKESIFNAIQYCRANNLPLAETVILK